VGVTYFKILFQHLPGGSEEKPQKKKTVKVINVLFKIQTGHLPNTSQKHYWLSQLMSSRRKCIIILNRLL
jgi:hypothetical protein